MYQQTNKNGFGIIEMLVAIGIFMILVIGGATYLTQGLDINRLADQETEATYYASEGLEAVRSIANQSWPSLDVGNTTCSGTLQKGVTVPTTTWAFTTAPQVRDGLSRTITIGNVCRDAAKNINTGGTVYDPNVKKVTSAVSWSFSPTRNNTVTLTDYLSNFRAELIGDWTNSSIGSTLDLAGNTAGLKIGVSGDFAYIVRPGATPNFIVVDISGTAPVQVGSTTLPGNPASVFVLGTFAYVASSLNTQELQIVNISTPSAPVGAGGFNAAGSSPANDVVVVGTTAYLVTNNSGSPELYIINVSNPAATTLIGSLNLNGNAKSIVVLGNSAAIASSDDNSELQVVNITTPATPTLAGVVNLGGTSDGSAIAGSGTNVMLGRLDGTVAIISIATPSAPSLTSTFGGAGGSINNISLGNHGNYMFLATTAGGAEFQAVNITTLSSPTLLSLINLSNPLNGIFYDPNYDLAFCVGQATASELIIIKPLVI